MNVQAETDHTDELAVKIFAYVDREAGRDAPLSPEDELMVRDLLKTDPAAQALAEDFRATNTSLDDLCNGGDIDVPDKLVSLILTHGDLNTESERDQEVTGEIIPFTPTPAPEKKTWVYHPLAAAASIVAIIASGGLLYQYKVHHQEKRQFQVELTNADTTLAAHNAELDEARVKQRAFRQRLASLVAENNRLKQEVEEKSGQIAEVETVRERIVAELDDTEILGETPLELDQSQFQRRMTELSEALAASEQKLAGDRASLAEAKRQAAAQARERVDMIQQGQARLTDLEERFNTASKEVADLTTERDNLAAKVAQSRQRIVALEGNFNATLGKIVGLNTANNQLASEKEQYRREASWLNQVAGYHRGYAGSMREVEISAKEQENKKMLTKWLASMMGQDFAVPDLSDSDLTFIGGRVFFVNGKPTGQIAYHDEEGRLTGFCFTANPDKPNSDPELGQHGDLNLVSWSKNGIDYVLVGWTASPELEWIAKGLQQTYGDDI